MGYNDNESEIIGLLNKRFNMLTEFLRVTKLVDLTADPDKFEGEAEDYIFLIEKRENMLKAIESVNERLQLPEFDFGSSDNIDFSQEAKEIAEKTKDLINQIIKTDKLNNAKATEIFKLLKNSIKDINNGKNIKSAYLIDLDFPNGGFYDYKS